MLMIILAHVLIAIISIIVATVVFVKPSITKLGLSYFFMISTVASGTFLLLSSPSNILKTCLVGLCYITVVSVVTIATHMKLRKFAKVTIQEDAE